MQGVIERIGTYFRRLFAPDRLHWNRIVEDEKNNRSCPRCGRFWSYIHIPTSIQEYWWGLYCCKGCKAEYHPPFTKGNLGLLVLLALFYFNYFGWTGFTYRTYLIMVVGFVLVLCVNYGYAKKGTRLSKTGLWLGALGWLLAAATTALAYHGEGLRNGVPRDVIYLIGSTVGFTFLAGSVLGLIPGVQFSIENILEFLLGDKDPFVKDNLEEDWAGGEERPSPEAMEDSEGMSHQDQQIGQTIPEAVPKDAPFAEGREGSECPPVREQRYRGEECYKDQPLMEKEAVDQKEVTQEGIDPDYERVQLKWWRRRQEDDSTRAFENFQKVLRDAGQRRQALYSDPEKWNKGLGQVFRDDGEVSYEVLKRARKVFFRSMEADVAGMAPEESHGMTESSIETIRDAKHNPMVRMGSALLRGGSSAFVFEPMDQLERMHDYIQYHEIADSDRKAIIGGFHYGFQELAEDKWAVREIKTLYTGRVEMPDDTTREAGTWDQIMSVVGVGLKGRDLHSTVVKGEAWNRKAFETDLDHVEEKGADFINKLRGRQGPAQVAPEGPEPAVSAGDAEPRGDGRGIPPEGTVPPRIPSHLADDYRSVQQAITNGDSAAADRFATRMLSKDQATFKMMLREGTIDSETAQGAVTTYQSIIADGVKKGLERTRQTGRVFQDQIAVDENGYTTSKGPVKHMWSPGTGMEPFDSKNPKVPEEVVLTPVVDRNICQARGLDPEDVQRLVAGHTWEAINAVARQRLGEDIVYFSSQTKVKTLFPGNDEEYHSFSANDIQGHVIDREGKLLDVRTHLAEKSWTLPLERVGFRSKPPSKDLIEFQERERALGIKREADYLWCGARPPHLERLAQDHPDFKALDDKLRKPWQEIRRKAIDDQGEGKDLVEVFPYGTYAAYLEKLDKEYHIYPEDPRLKTWYDAAMSGEWPPQEPGVLKREF